jgi:hypothetical protein
MKKTLCQAVLVFVVLLFSASAQEFDRESEELDTMMRSAGLLDERLMDEPGYGFALLVGLDKYDSGNVILPDLKAPAGEMKALAGILGGNRYVVKTLLDSDATADRVRRWIACMGARAHLQDRFLVYFACHGGNLLDLARSMGDSAKKKIWERIQKVQKADADQLLLCLHQPIPNELSDFVFVEDVTQWISKSPAHQQIVWIDACYSGNMNKAFQLPLQFYSYRLLNDGFFAVTGVKAPVFDGMYGRWMLEGLHGAADDSSAGNRDGMVSLYESAVYSDARLRRDVVINSGETFKSRYMLIGSGEVFLTLPTREKP